MYEDTLEVVEESKSKEKLWYVFVFLVIIGIIGLLFVFSGKKKVEEISICGNDICEAFESNENCCIDCGCPKGYKCKNNKCVLAYSQQFCGNGICEASENCYTCPKDCKCKENEYCSEEKKKCITPICGNGICEPFEAPENCCIDCGCTIPGEICNKKTKKCELQKINLTEEEIRKIVTSYFESQNMKVKSLTILGSGIYQNTLIERVKIKIEGEEWFRYVGVTEEGKVIELPVMD